MAFFLKYRSAVVEETSFEMKQVFWLKIETMDEDWVKPCRVCVCRTSRVFAFGWIKGVTEVKAVRLRGIIFDFN